MTTLPELTTEHADLIDRYIASGESLHALAASTSTPLRQLLAWALSDPIAPWIAILKSERASHLRGRGLATLDSLLTAPLNPIEARRASTTLLRHTPDPTRAAPRRADTPARGPHPSNLSARFPPHAKSHTSPTHLTASAGTTNTGTANTGTTTSSNTTSKPVDILDLPRASLFTPSPGTIPIKPGEYLPSPDNTLEHVLDHLMSAIQYPDAPTPGAGAITLHNFHINLAHNRDPDAPRRTLDRFRASVPEALNIADARSGPIQHTPHSTWAAREYTIITKEDQRLILRIDVTRRQWGTFAHCWMLAGITIRVPHCPYNPYLPDRVLEYPSKDVPLRNAG